MPSGWPGAGVSAGLLATLALTAIVVSHVGLGQTELAQAAAAKKTALPAVPGLSTQPVDKAETKKLFSYLSAESYTPKNEQSFLANRLGEDATTDAHVNTARQLKRGKVPVKEEKEPNHDVAYFSKFLLPPPPHFTRGGMHAATYQTEQARAKQGIVDDDGEHYLNKAAGKQLAKELDATQEKYLFSENHGIVWQSPEEERQFQQQAQARMTKEELLKAKPIKNLDHAEDKVLAEDLEGGIAYATLPNHGVPVKEEPVKATSKYTGMVHGKAGKKLAEDLEAGEHEALAFEAAQAEREEQIKAVRRHIAPVVHSGQHVPGTLDKAEGEKLAASLIEGEREAFMAPYGYLDKGAKAKGAHKSQHAHKSAPTITLKSVAPKVSKRVAPRIMAARQRKLQALYMNKPKDLTLAQDKNVAAYLSQGLSTILNQNKPEVKVQHFLSKENGEKLVAAAELDQKAEIKKWAPQPQKFEGRKAGMRLAMEMEKSLRKENRAGGAYVNKYLHRVTGSPLAGRQRARYVMTGNNEGEKWYNEQLGKRLEKGLGWEKKQQALKYRKEHQKYLNPKQMIALRNYMQPVLHVAKGVAPGLGFAV
mmetsp:Transcript_95555/g.139568  ORF Transcript_95555/g.139568 Transcript_95555/m.139568 type:complete len:591 (-) Transcript_95555:59-1831(-)